MGGLLPYYSSLTTLDQATPHSAYSTPEGSLELVHTTTGERVWKLKQAGGILGHPSFADGGAKLVYGTLDSRVVARSVADGSRAWEAKLGSALAAPVLVVGGTVFGLGLDGRWSALSATDGALSQGAELTEAPAKAK